MRKIPVKLSEKVYYMSSVLNIRISDLIRESLITRENEALLEHVSSKYNVSKEDFINSAIDCIVLCRYAQKEVRNN